jgi:hypothetical protein
METVMEEARAFYVTTEPDQAKRGTKAGSSEGTTTFPERSREIFIFLSVVPQELHEASTGFPHGVARPPVPGSDGHGVA